MQLWKRGHQLGKFAGDHVGPEDHAETVGIDRLRPMARLLGRHFGRRDRELNIAAHHLQALAILHELFRIEIDDLAAERRRQVGRIVEIQSPHAASAFARAKSRAHPVPMPIGQTTPAAVTTISFFNAISG